MDNFQILSAVILGKAVTDAAIDVSIVRDFGLETTSTSAGVLFTATGSETHVFKRLDDLVGQHLCVAQIKFTDISTPTATWELNRFDLRENKTQKA